MKAGAFVIDMSSADPVGTRELGADLAQHKIALVDAPVSGGVPRAKDGSLAIMIGGDAAAVAKVKPVLTCMGSKLFEVGSLGCGHAMKCLNNFLAGTSFRAAAEAVTVGTQIRARSEGDGRRDQCLDRPQLRIRKPDPAACLSGAFGTGFALGLLAKDVRIAADLADQIGVDAPVGRLIRDLWADARENAGRGSGSHPRRDPLGKARAKSGITARGIGAICGS